MAYAVIENDKVLNLVEADAEFAAAQGWVPAADSRIGDLWDGEKFTPAPPPPPVVPAQVARAQGKAALIGAGLWAGVEAFVAAIIDPTERALAEVALHDTQQWQRNSPFLNAAKDGLGLTDEQLDELFVAASKIEL